MGRSGVCAAVPVGVGARAARFVVEKLDANFRVPIMRAVASLHVNDAAGEEAFAGRRAGNALRHAKVKLDRLADGEGMVRGKADTAGRDVEGADAVGAVNNIRTTDAQRDSQLETPCAPTLGSWHRYLLAPADGKAGKGGRVRQ
jgi:hypothetical protein